MSCTPSCTPSCPSIRRCTGARHPAVGLLPLHAKPGTLPRYGQLGTSSKSGTWDFQALPLELSVCGLEPTGCSSTDYKITSAVAGGESSFVRVLRNPCQPGFHGVPPFGRPGPDGVCTRCPPGTWTNTWGQSACTPCAAGTFVAGPNATSCSACASGSYSAEGGQGQCTRCPGNTTMSRNGSSSLSDCLPLCREGNYSSRLVNGYAVEPCSRCPAGMLTAARGLPTCAACPQGTYSLGGAGLCTPCGTNRSTRFNASTGPGDCIDMCPAGYSGLYGVSNCSNCTIGTFTALPGATACLACAANLTTRGAGDVKCSVPCGPGEVGDRGVGPGCYKCGVGQIPAPGRSGASGPSLHNLGSARLMS